MRSLWFPAVLSVACLLPLVVTPARAAGVAADPDDTEGVGADMGYRMYGTAKKDRPLLLQNSRPGAVQVFEERLGVYVEIPSYSDREFACSGKTRVLHVRFVDSFGESAPFQVRIGCGRELQFIDRKQVASPVPGVEMPVSADPVAHPAMTRDAADADDELPLPTGAIRGEDPNVIIEPLAVPAP